MLHLDWQSNLRRECSATRRDGEGLVYPRRRAVRLGVAENSSRVPQRLDSRSSEGLS
jgi:hypothetical protein